jgi:hypothetical protein
MAHVTVTRDSFSCAYDHMVLPDGMPSWQQLEPARHATYGSAARWRLCVYLCDNVIMLPYTDECEP